MKDIKNKPMFYTGLSFQIANVVLVSVLGLSFLDWTWLYNIATSIALVIKSIDGKLLLMGMFLALYNLASFVMMYEGWGKHK